jgi:hypothetical protein
MRLLLLYCLLNLVMTISGSTTCVCTTVPCPVSGKNTLHMGGGSAVITYQYMRHGDYDVVTSASGDITSADLDHGTDTTSCTQKYARQLDDDGIQDCDAGHILANRLGGYGNEPMNIFPQASSINRGAYAQFENNIYDCVQSGATSTHLQWLFTYDNSTETKPVSVDYSASFLGGKCTYLASSFTNTG